MHSSWYCRATTGNPRCFCKTDDGNKNTLHLIKQVKENSNKDAVKTFYILMMQSRSIIIIGEEVGISDFKSRPGEEVRSNPIEKPAHLELFCSMKYCKCYGRQREVHLSQLLLQPRNANISYAAIVLAQKNYSPFCVLACLDSDHLSAKVCC